MVDTRALAAAAVVDLESAGPLLCVPLSGGVAFVTPTHPGLIRRTAALVPLATAEPQTTANTLAIYTALYTLVDSLLSPAPPDIDALASYISNGLFPTLGESPDGPSQPILDATADVFIDVVWQVDQQLENGALLYHHPIPVPITSPSPEQPPAETGDSMEVDSGPVEPAAEEPKEEGDKVVPPSQTAEELDAVTKKAAKETKDALEKTARLRLATLVQRLTVRRSSLECRSARRSLPLRHTDVRRPPNYILSRAIRKHLPRSPASFSSG